MPTSLLTPDQHARAEALVAPAIAFLTNANYPLGVALVRRAWQKGPAEDVVAALAAYQNPDGGFGKGLEVDIGSPASNPFAARLAMQALLTVPLDISTHMRERLRAWLVANQHDDGDWHFSEETKQGALSPWFAAWEFPSLNPACCVAGHARHLDLATPKMLDRVRALFASKASLDDTRSGDFYTMLPYVEYATHPGTPDRDRWITAIAEGIRGADERGTYADAQHFLDHALPAGPDVLALLPPGVLERRIDQLVAEPQDDGGWPSPYSEAWRPWFTTAAMLTLARLHERLDSA